MNKRDILKMILSGTVEPEKLPLFIKAANAAEKVLFAVKIYEDDEPYLPDDLFTTRAGMFHDDPTAPTYTHAELEAFAALGVNIPVIVFVGSVVRDQDGNIASEDVDRLLQNEPHG